MTNEKVNLRVVILILRLQRFPTFFMSGLSTESCNPLRFPALYAWRLQKIVLIRSIVLISAPFSKLCHMPLSRQTMLLTAEVINGNYSTSAEYCSAYDLLIGMPVENEVFSSLDSSENVKRIVMHPSFIFFSALGLSHASELPYLCVYLFSTPEACCFSQRALLPISFLVGVS